MADEATAPAEQAAETTQETTSQVRNPEAVLKQNEELLAEVKRLKKLTKDADGFDFAKARAALEQQEKAEAEHLHTLDATTANIAKGDYKFEVKATYGSNVLIFPTDYNGERTYGDLRVQEPRNAAA